MKYHITGYQAEAVERSAGNLSFVTGWSADGAEDTLKEAQRVARWMLTDEYQTRQEMSEPLVYVQVRIAQRDERGECVADFFRKGYTLPDPPCESLNSQLSTLN